MAEAPSDWSLVDRVKAGDDGAFDQLMARYQRPVTDYACRMLLNAADADDTAQEVFVRAYTAIRRPSFQSSGATFPAWLFRVARHAALDRLRYRKRHPSIPLESAPETAGQTTDPHPTARDTLVAREVEARIADAVSQLPEDQRTALLLARYEGQSHAAIAETLGCTEKSVEARLYRARQFLRRRLADMLR